MKKQLVVLGVVVAMATAFVVTISATITSTTADKTGTLSAGGTSVTVTGTLVCTDGNLASITAYVFQTSGKTEAIAAAAGPDITCTGEIQTWSLSLPVLVGTGLKKGPATFFGAANDPDGSGPIMIQRIQLN